MHDKKLSLFITLMMLSANVMAIDLHECYIGTENSVNKVKAECGTLAVAENRENPTRMIDLNIAIVRSKSSEKEKDPVIMLAGGPGQSAVDTFPQARVGFSKILKHRDVVLVDQRGTGHSNKIACDFDQETQDRMLQDMDIIPDEIAKCVKNLDADTRFYTTTESIKDLEEVRKALNIEQWNLIGISYGTRKALTYMKMFPDAIRSVVLDSVVPQQEPLAQSHEKNLLSALHKQFELCKQQAPCDEAFGDVEQQMWQLLDKVEKEKPVIKLLDSQTGEYQDVTVTKDYLTGAIRMFAYSPISSRLLPLLITKANNGQLETLAAQAKLISSMMQESLSNVELSIICAEDLPFYNEYQAPAHNMFGTDLAENMQKNCAVWPHSQVDASFKDPVVSDIPTLLLSGELDPVTPPEFAKLAKQTLSHSQHLILKGQGHSSFTTGCMPKILGQFFQDPTAELETKCLDYLDYEPFFINMMGPKQ
jgi:pimeloyl-ACP methyl ester carboxylesterase